MIGQAKEYMALYRAALATLGSLSADERDEQVFGRGKTIETYAHEIAQSGLQRALKLHQEEQPELAQRRKERGEDG